MNHHPDVDLRYPHLTVSLMSHDVDAVTARDIRLAKKISDLAADAGASPAAHAPDVLEYAIDTPDHEKIRPFWAAHPGLGRRRRRPSPTPPTGTRASGSSPATPTPPTASAGTSTSACPTRSPRNASGPRSTPAAPWSATSARHRSGSWPTPTATRPASAPGRAATDRQSGTAVPFPRDGWQTELSADDVRGHAVSMRRARFSYAPDA